MPMIYSSSSDSIINQCAVEECTALVVCMGLLNGTTNVLQGFCGIHHSGRHPANANWITRLGIEMGISKVEDATVEYENAY